MPMRKTYREIAIGRGLPRAHRHRALAVTSGIPAFDAVQINGRLEDADDAPQAAPAPI